MATQLKDLKFGDYTLKGETTEGTTRFVLGSNDSLGFVNSSSGAYNDLIYYSGSGTFSGYWAFRGTAEKADTVTCYSYEDPSSVAGTYKLLVNGSGAISATLVS